ncbi:MAG: hypothetical protein O3C43_17780 [Verrucomicrobia bacterium]|nr:hypothetical protein [Verrucomicrobiota bacterium]MDA1068342.1 hypothetical protein [Verrucomicrobiota bacterium]
MLFIFRKLRRSFFLPGKVRTYVAYAIGEIALIVIGILIALQIGEWNQARADEKLKDSYIARLIENIQSDLGSFEILTNLNEIGVSFLELLMQVAKDPEIVRHRPVEFMAAVNRRKTVLRSNLYTDTYQDLLSTGNMRLMEDALKKAIFSYYHVNQRVRIGEVVEDNLSIQYSHLQRGVLTNEQANWLLDHYPRVNKIHMEVIRAETYDGESVVESAYRLQRKTELVQILPEMKAIFSNGLRNVIIQEREANQLLEALQAELEN